ncbi:hypothetical protein IWQ57_006411, partial [Coemansia nantahalensis]
AQGHGGRDRRGVCIHVPGAAGRARDHVQLHPRGAGVLLAGVWLVPVHQLQGGVYGRAERADHHVRVADAGEHGPAAPAHGDRAGVRDAAVPGAGDRAAVVRHVCDGRDVERLLAGGGAGGVHCGAVCEAQPGQQRAPVPAQARHDAAVPRGRESAADQLRGSAGGGGAGRGGVYAAQGANHPVHARQADDEGRDVAGAEPRGAQDPGIGDERRPGGGERGGHGVVPQDVPAGERRGPAGVCGPVDPGDGVPGVPLQLRVQPQKAGGRDHDAPRVDQLQGDGAVGAAAAVPRADDGAHPRGGRDAVRARAGHPRDVAQVRGAVQHKVQADPAQHQAVPHAADGGGGRGAQRQHGGARDRGRRRDVQQHCAVWRRERAGEA